MRTPGCDSSTDVSGAFYFHLDDERPVGSFPGLFGTDCAHIVNISPLNL